MADDENPSDDVRVQRSRAWTGLWVVVAGDAVIAAAAVVALIKLNSTETSQLVAILTAAFTAVSTMTTAYFGIRAVTNTAQSAVTANQQTQIAAQARLDSAGR